MIVFKRIALCGLIAALHYWNAASAQNCTGTVSTGQNLVTNGDFSNLNTGWTHDPAYTDYLPCTGCWSVPGNIYAGSVPKNFNDAFGNIQDHSTSGDNNFLMVDGICTVGIDLWKQTNIPIIPNTNYYFSVWITSLSPATASIAGTLNFNINGVDLPTTIAAPGVVGQWIRFPGVVWNSGLNPPSSISISIQNTTVNGCDQAVDFGIDDITFTQGCDFGVTGPQPNLGADFSLCGRTLPFNINPNLSAATAASPNLTYTWYKDGVQQTKGMGPSFYNFSVNSAGTYAVCVDSAGSCPKSDNVVINSNYTITLGPAITLCNSATANLDVVYTGPGVTYQWYRNSILLNGETNRTLTVSTAGSYSVTVHDPVCGDRTASVNVSSSLPTTTDGTFCPRDQRPATLTASGGTGSYNWYSASTGGSSLATGSNFTSPVLAGPGPYTYYVQNSNGTCVRVPAVATLSCSPCTTQPPVRVWSRDSVFCSATTSTIRLSVVGGSGSKLVWYSGSCGGTQVGTNTTGADITITAPPVATTYFARWETLGCLTSCGSVTVTPFAPPGNSIAGAKQKLCNATTTTLAANSSTVAGASGIWSVVSGTGNVTNPADPHSNVTGLVEGNLVLRWTLSNGPCPVSSSLDTIHVDLLSAPVISGASARQCATATGVVYSTTVNHSPSSSYVWASTGSIAITSHPANTAIVNVGASGGLLTVTETKGACTFSSSINIISVLPLTSSSAGPDQQICNATSAVLAAVPPQAPSIGFWKIVSGTGSIASADTTKFNAPVTGLAAGNLVLRWTIRNSPCADSTDDVILHQDVLTAPVITGGALSQCATATGVTYATTVNNSPASTYTWTKTGSLVITSHPANSAVVDVGSSGGVLTVTETKGACNFSSTVTINSVQPLTNSSAGPDQQICNASIATLAATAPAPPSIGFWKIINGTGLIPASDTTKSNATVSGLVEGDVVLRWTIRNSPCADSTDDVIINKAVLTAPVLTGASFNQCATSTAAVYSTTIDRSPASTYTWATTGSLVVTSHPNNTAIVSIGNNGGTITVTETKGACSFSDSRNITSSRAPDPSAAGVDQHVCNLNSVTLSANTPTAPSIGFWTIISGTGSIAFADSTKPNAVLSGLVEGDVHLRWTIRNSPCADSSDDVIIHKDVLDTPVLSLTGASYDTCALATGITYTTTLNNSPANSYSWTTSGSPNTLIVTSSSSNMAVINVGASGGTLTVTETNGACSLSASKEIRITPDVTAAYAGPDQKICVSTTFLQATSLQVGNGEWTVLEGTGTFADASDPHTSVSGLSSGRNTYRWTVKGCGGPLSDDVRIETGASDMVIGPLTGPTDTLCVGTPRVLTLTVAGGSSHYFYVWKSSDSSFNTVITYTPVIVVPLVNSTTYYVYAVDSINQGCKSGSDSITVYAVSKQNLSMNNLMTPNDDNLNDKLIIRDAETLQNIMPGSRLDVFNEWGSRVYQSENYDNTWEAPGLTDGVYYYHLKAGCGSDVYKGWVQILR
jgi:hypothetical protein